LVEEAVKAGAANDNANKAASDGKKAKDVLDARFNEAGNNVDGLLHGANGKEFPAGGLVGGVNQLVGKTNQKKLFDIMPSNDFQTLDENEEHQDEIRNARVQAVKNDKMRQVQEARAQHARA